MTSSVDHVSSRYDAGIIEGISRKRVLLVLSIISICIQTTDAHCCTQPEHQTGKFQSESMSGDGVNAIDLPGGRSPRPAPASLEV